MPWEKPIETLKNSLLFLGGLFVIIGLVWAGYKFIGENDKESGFKKLIGTLIGAAIIFGASGIISILFGANF